MKRPDKLTRRVFSALDILYADTKMETLGDRLIGSVMALVPADISALNTFSMDGVMLAAHAITPAGAVPATLQRRFIDLVHEHPIHSAAVRNDAVVNPFTSPVRLSDLITLQRFKQLAIYDEFFRELGVDRQLLVSVLRPGHTEAIALNRSAADFSVLEVDLLTEMQPHLQRAISTARTNRDLAWSQARAEGSLVAAAGFGIIRVTQRLRVESIDQRAREMLASHVEMKGSGWCATGSYLPDPLHTWLQKRLMEDSCAFTGSPQTSCELFLARGGSTLRVRVAHECSSSPLFLLLSTSTTIDPQGTKLLEGLRLTPRQAEMLAAVVTGKSSKQIAGECKITEATVKKHLENIYDRLQVENRTAAAAKAVSFLASHGVPPDKSKKE